MSNVEYIHPVCDGACRALWLAIIQQALLDLIRTDETEEGLLVSGDARRWFFLVNGNFPMVCNLAGVDPMAIRKRAREIETNPKLLGHPHV